MVRKTAETTRSKSILPFQPVIHLPISQPIITIDINRPPFPTLLSHHIAHAIVSSTNVTHGLRARDAQNPAHSPSLADPPPNPHCQNSCNTNARQPHLEK